MAVRDVGNLRTRLSFEDQGTMSSLQRFRQDLTGLRSEMQYLTSQGREYANSLKGLKQQQDILNRSSEPIRNESRNLIDGTKKR